MENKWVKSDGTVQNLADMDTCHLFYTLRLIWNSMMPRPLSVGTFKSVYFTPRLYTSEYWSKCLPAMFNELHSRTDLPKRYKEQLANIQLEALLERTNKANLNTAINSFLEREDTEYIPEKGLKTWDNEKAELDLSYSHHTLVKCPRCNNKFPGKRYYDKVRATCLICTSQFDYKE